MNPDHLVGAVAVLLSLAVLYPYAVIKALAWWEQRQLCGTGCDHCPDPVDVAQEFHDDLAAADVARVIAAAETLTREAAS